MGNNNSNNTAVSIDNSKQYTCITDCKTLFHLRSCLTNSFYPDYDFSEAHPDEFSREPNFYWVKKHVQNTLSVCIPKENLNDSNYNSCRSSSSDLLEDLWHEVNKVIEIEDCRIYSYNPSISTNDPFENCLWSFAFM